MTSEGGGFFTPKLSTLADRKISDREYRVYNAVLSFAWEVGGGICSASVKSIAERAGGKCRRQTTEILARLVAKGVLIEEPDSSKITGRVFRPAEIRRGAETRRSTLRKPAPTPVRKPAPKIDDSEADEAKQMKMMGPSSSSSPSASPEEGKRNSEDQAQARAIAAVMVVFSDGSTPAKAAKLVVDYGPTWVERAAETARKKAAKGADVKWGYLLGILKNYKAEGGPPPDAKALAAPKPTGPTREERGDAARRDMMSMARSHLRVPGRPEAAEKYAFYRELSESQGVFLDGIGQPLRLFLYDLDIEEQRQILAQFAASVRPDIGNRQREALKVRQTEMMGLLPASRYMQTGDSDAGANPRRYQPPAPRRQFVAAEEPV